MLNLSPLRCGSLSQVVDDTTTTTTTNKKKNKKKNRRSRSSSLNRKSRNKQQQRHKLGFHHHSVPPTTTTTRSVRSKSKDDKDKKIGGDPLQLVGSELNLRINNDYPLSILESSPNQNKRHAYTKNKNKHHRSSSSSSSSSTPRCDGEKILDSRDDINTDNNERPSQANTNTEEGGGHSSHDDEEERLYQLSRIIYQDVGYEKNDTNNNSGNKDNKPLLSKGTLNSVRKRGGLNEIEHILSSSSSSSSRSTSSSIRSGASKNMGNTPSRVRHQDDGRRGANDKSRGRIHEERMIRKLHGGGGITKSNNNDRSSGGSSQQSYCPTCPTCRGKLTYLYISSSTPINTSNNNNNNPTSVTTNDDKGSQHQKSPTTNNEQTFSTTTTRIKAYKISETNITNTNNNEQQHEQHTTFTYKLNNILPPLCIECCTHYIFDESSSTPSTTCSTDNEMLNKGDDVRDDDNNNIKKKGVELNKQNKYNIRMLDNLGRWLESDAYDDDEYDMDCNSNDDDTGRKEGEGVDYPKYPKCSKLVVINSKPQVFSTIATQNNKQQMGIQVGTSFNNDNINNSNITNGKECTITITPRLSNSSSTTKSNTRFKFDEYTTQLSSPIFGNDNSHDTTNILHREQQQQQQQQDVFSGISSLSNVSYHRDDSRHHYITRFNDGHNANGRSSDRNDSNEDDEEMYLSDDDPFTNVCNNNDEEDDGSRRDGRTTALPIPSTTQPQCQTDNNDDCANLVEKKQQPANNEVLSSSKNDNKSHSKEGSYNNSYNNNNDDNMMMMLQLIHTKSEERNILSQYTIKRDIATKQITKDIIRGYTLTDLLCSVCNMPMTRNTTTTNVVDNGQRSNEIIECTTCLAVKRNAKRIARQKRKKIIRLNNTTAKNIGQHDCTPAATAAAATTDDDDKVTKNNVAVNDTQVNEEDVTRPSCVVNEDNIDFVPIEDTLCTLEEGLQQMLRMEKDGSRSLDIMHGDSNNCSEDIHHGNNSSASSSSEEPTSSSASSLHEQQFEEVKPAANHDCGGDGNYWVHHSSSSQLSCDTINRDSTSSSTSHSHHHHQNRGEDYSHSTNNGIEYSLSWYQENTNQQHQRCESISEVSAYPREGGQDNRGDKVKSREVMQEQLKLSATDVYSSSQCSNQIIYQESISEVSEYCNHNNNLLQSCSSDEVSSTRCPRTIPSDEMIYKYNSHESPPSNNNNDHVMTEEEVEENHSIINGCTYQESISEVSEYDNKGGAVPPSMKNSKICQTTNVISIHNDNEESCNQPPVGEEGTMSSSSTRRNNEQNIAVRDDNILPQGSSSEESMISVTRCPRDLPPSEMIYPILYPIQSIPCEQRGTTSEIGTSVVNDVQLEQGIVEPQQVTGCCQSMTEQKESRGIELSSEVNPVQEVPTTTLFDTTEDMKMAQNQLPPLLNEATDHRDGPDQMTSFCRKVDDSLCMRIDRLANSIKDVASQFPNDGHVITSQTSEDEIGQYNDNELAQGNRQQYHQPSSNMSVISESNSGFQKRNYHPLSSSPIVVNEQNTVSASHPTVHFWNHDKEGMANAATQPVKRGSINCVSGISISPINVSRDEKRFDDIIPEVETPCLSNNVTQRSSPPGNRAADPPGRRLESNSEERLDPPDNTLNGSPSPKPRTHDMCLPRRNNSNTGRDDPPQESAPTSRERRRDKVPNVRSNAKPSSVLDPQLPEEVCDEVSPEPDTTVSILTKQSWGESSMDELFQQIDEIEDDFNTIVSQMPSGSSLGQSTTQSLKNSSKQCNELEQSLVGITLNNVGSFESYASSEDSMVNGVVERMRVIKNYIEQVDSLDDDVSVDSQDDEMTELMKRLSRAADSLRKLNEWE